MKKDQYTHKITEFQKNFIEDGETILKVVEALYPDVDINIHNRGKIKVTSHPYYTWVEIKYENWVGDNFINFAIDNHECGLWGKISNEIYNKASFKFNIILFSDCKYNKSVTDVRIKRAQKILKDAGYKKPSFEEFWNEYHTG